MGVFLNVRARVTKFYSSLVTPFWRNHIHVHHSHIPFRLNTLKKDPLTQHSSVKQAVPKPNSVVSEAPVIKSVQKHVSKSVQSVPKLSSMTVTHSGSISVPPKRLGV